ncbi:MAG: hypothetical protein J2O47_06035, partial [Acidimicrobiaceae bacterium]|nr:hypothetical protein [Acidimicrobiaceae bacterium]
MSQNGVADEGMLALVERLAAGIRLPKVGLVAQRSTIPALEDVAGKARTEVRRVLAAEPEAAGDRGPIAVGVGSRGIAHLAVIVGAVVDELKGAGYRPFVVPAMGSHGGGTPEGQLEVLSDYGISEATLGVPL